MRLKAALVAAGLLVLLNLASLIGAGYARYANAHLDRPDSPSTQAAARIAGRWPPWSSTHAAMHGWVLAENGDAGGARAAYGRALRLAPADAVLWGEYSLALARLGQFDGALTLATRQARTLAPTSAAVRSTIAELGLSYWGRGSEEQRALWLDAMRAELARNRGAFLGHVLTRGKRETFCGGAARRLAEDEWCASSAALQGGCYDLKPAGPVPCKRP